MQISPSPAFSVWNFTKQEAQVGMNHIMQPVFLLGKIAETCTFYAWINPKIQINLLESMHQYCRGEFNNVSANQMSKRPYVSKDQHEKQNDSFSAASEWILRKLYWTQDLNILNQACAFLADPSTKMAALASDWLTHFSTSPMQPLNGNRRNVTGNKIPTSSATLNVFSGQSVKNGHNGLWSTLLLLLWSRCLDFNKILFGFLILIQGQSCNYYQ